MTLSADPDTPAFAERAALDGSGVAWHLSGALTVRSVSPVAARLSGLTGQLDLSGLTRLDTAGAYLLQSHAASLQLTGARPDHAALLDRVGGALPQPPDPDDHRWSAAQLLERVGRTVAGAGGFMVEITAMLGLFLARVGQILRHPGQLPMTALVHHADQVGWRAIPIVSLMSFLIGVVLAFQGAVQLRQFGAEIFVVDLIAISILRELGILLTAIIVAGRTASSFTAAIGSMKMREEIDAMRTLAIDPALVLFVPRILALLITLPILGPWPISWACAGRRADVLGRTGRFTRRVPGALAGGNRSRACSGRVREGAGFRLIIGVIGCHAGMQVGGNAESLGRRPQRRGARDLRRDRGRCAVLDLLRADGYLMAAMWS